MNKETMRFSERCNFAQFLFFYTWKWWVYHITAIINLNRKVVINSETSAGLHQLWNVIIWRRFTNYVLPNYISTFIIPIVFFDCAFNKECYRLLSRQLRMNVLFCNMYFLYAWFCWGSRALQVNRKLSWCRTSSKKDSVNIIVVLHKYSKNISCSINI